MLSAALFVAVAVCSGTALRVARREHEAHLSKLLNDDHSGCDPGRVGW